MNELSGPPRERRRHRRLTAENVRVRLVSGGFDDLASGVTFARRLINIGIGGMCVETTGRLRPGVKMSAEVRFDDFVGALRTQAQLIWAETVKQGASEVHLAGFRFVGPELTAPVRDFLEGGRATMIVTKRRAEYEDLKQKSEARKAGVGPKKWGAPKKTAAIFLVLIFVYVASFGGLVFAGRRESQSPGIHFRYTGAESKGGGAEESLSKLYYPLYWAFRKAGIELVYDAP